MYQLECYGLYIESNTFLEDVFESFRNKCLNTCNLDPTNFYSPPGLVWIGPQRKSVIDLTLLTNINMLLIIGSGIKGEIRYFVLHRKRVIVKYKENYKNLQ